jgi:hypothetical protein
MPRSFEFDIHRGKAVLIDAMYTELQHSCFEEKRKGKEKRSDVGIWN